jgi:hypothetical protein
MILNLLARARVVVAPYQVLRAILGFIATSSLLAPTILLCLKVTSRASLIGA